MKTKLLVSALAAVTVLGVRAHAHHSFAATYLEGEQMKVEADIVQFLYRNPHSFLQMESKGPDGKVIAWAVEWGGGGQLGSQGVTRDTLRPGDHVIVLGEPGRDPEAHRLRMINITRPSDGWTWKGTFN